MNIVFLDQNKWIDLARVESGSQKAQAIVSTYHHLRNSVDRGVLLCPLSFAHIGETSKRNDPVSRINLARTQAQLSKGMVLRSRKGRLLVEIRNALLKAFGEPPMNLPDNWAIAPGFLQACDQFDQLTASGEFALSAGLLNQHIEPQEQLLDYLSGQDDTARRDGIIQFTRGAQQLASELEVRRVAGRGLKRDVKSGLYAAKLFYHHQQIIGEQLLSIGRSHDDLRSLGAQAVVTLMEDVPTLNIERLLAVKLDSQSRAIQRNDLLDMHSMCAAVQYSDYFVGENT